MAATAAMTKKPVYSGWLSFAGILGVMVGIFNITSGLLAIFRDNYYVVVDDQLLFFNLTGWGWVWLILGVVQVIVGFGILGGADWARGAGVGLAALAIFFHLLWLPVFPLWSLIVIILAVLVIYGLIVPPARAQG